MTRDDELEAMRYLLDELEPAERAAFERRIESDPTVATAVRTTSDALATLALQTAPPEALAPADQRAALGQVLATMAAEPDRPARLETAWGRRVWPVAASLLLLLNLWQWSRPVYPAVDDNEAVATRAAASRTEAAGEGGARPAAGDAEGVAGDTAPGLDAAGATGPAEGDGAVGRDPAAGTEEVRRLRQIRSEYARLQRRHDDLRAEHADILGQLAEYALIERGVNRLAAMELVDAQSYADGRRNGLLDFALSLLTEPGIVALTPAGTVTPTPEGDGGVVIPQDPLAAGEVTPGANGGSTTNGTPLDGPRDPSTAVAGGNPYAWSVYDEANDRGFLNLYNLPQPTGGETLELWVRPLPDSPYVHVGAVPQSYHGGSGSLFYTVPGLEHPPVEILITQEPGEARPAQPSGATVLRGP